MTVRRVAEAHYRQQKGLGRRIAEQAARLWGAVDPADIDRSFARVADRLLALVTGGQLLAASASDRYVAEAMAAQRLDPTPQGQVRPQAWAGVAADGRPLPTLLREPVIHAKVLIAQGRRAPGALLSAGLGLDMIVRSEIADAGRTADGVATAIRPAAAGYVRMLDPPSCSRCVILAGRVYKWSAAFLRHPRCDCRHIPVGEQVADDLTTNPYAYFKSLPRQEQDRIFTVAGARAIRDGGDMSQVVNARRGMRTTMLHGQEALVTTEGMTRRGLARQRLGPRAVRLMPEQIYADADRLGLSREETLEVLRLHGYII